MPEFIRTFVAIPVMPTRALENISTSLAELGWPIRGCHIRQLHVTLAFLGDTPFEQVPEISSVLDQVVRAHNVLSLELTGLGVFPNPSRPRVIWSGLSPKEGITELANEVSSAIADLGFPRDERSFQPHLTLAYVKGRPPGELQTLMLEHAQSMFGGVTVEHVHFYQSELTNSGPRYTILSEHALAD